MILLTAQQTWPFGAAMGVLVGLLVLEGVGLAIAQSPSQLLDHLVPDVPDDASGLLGWLHLGKVPVLVLFMLLLAGFALTGYVIQATAHSITGVLVPAWLASVPAAFGGVAALRLFGTAIGKIIPKDETVAVSSASLVGRAAVIVNGHAKSDLAAEAKVLDVHGRAHYVMVVPDDETEVFPEGTRVLLVSRAGINFHAIQNPHPELL